MGERSHWSIIHNLRAYKEPHWQPSVDIYQGENHWLIKFDLAGIKKDDIQIEFHGRCLTVLGYRRDLSLNSGRRAYSMEICYNRFERSIELPIECEQAALRSEYVDGMLLVILMPGEGDSYEE